RLFSSLPSIRLRCYCGMTGKPSWPFMTMRRGFRSQNRMNWSLTDWETTMSPSTPANTPKIPFQANPFTSLAVGSPWTDTPTDVERINDVPFKLLRHGVRQVRAGNAQISIVVTGEPGSGKTHLLSRLKRY